MTYPCPHCERILKTPQALKSHLRGHDGSAREIARRRPLGHYPCPHCPRVFQTPIGLSNHVRTHTGQSQVMAKKIGATRRRLGIAKGERNPNYGDKERPWLEGDNHPLRQWHRNNPDFGDNQRGENNPIHRVRHLYEDPEYVERITRGLMAHVDERRGSTYEEVYGEEKAAEYKEKLRRASPARLAKFHRKETGPERIVREMLEELEVVFVPQAPLGHYTVDFLVPAPKLVIQADGDYWHAHPDIYGEGEGRTPLSKIQRKRRRLDASCDSYLRNRGYSVLRLWESDLRDDLPACRVATTRAIKGVK